MYKVEFAPGLSEVIAKWKKSNPQQHKKLIKIIQDIAHNPRSELGHPEPLVGGNGIVYSRRITKWDRIIYNVYDDEVLVIVIDVKGHYGDK